MGIVASIMQDQNLIKVKVKPPNLPIIETLSDFSSNDDTTIISPPLVTVALPALVSKNKVAKNLLLTTSIFNCMKVRQAS